MIVDGIGLTIDSFEAIYTTGGTEVIEIYAGLNYTDLVYSSDMTIVGCPPLLFTANGRPLKDYTILGNSYQDGVPDPDHPVEVVSVGEKTENLWDPSDTSLDRVFEIEPRKSYKLAKHSPILSARADLTIYDAEMNELWSSFAQIWSGVSFPGNYSLARYARAKISNVPRSVTDPEKYIYFGIGKGSDNINTDIPYGYKIPVTVSDGTNTQTYPIYLSEPLRKIGDYADEIDFKAGTVTRRIKEYVVTGAESDWYTYNLSHYRPFSDEHGIIYSTDVLCNRFRYSKSISPNMGECVKGANANILFKFDNGGKLNDFKAWLAQLYAYGTPMIVYRTILNPPTEPITAPTILTINGQNTLMVDTTVQPSSVSITGHIKPSSIYGNLIDVNGKYIKDKDGMQIKVTG